MKANIVPKYLSGRHLLTQLMIDSTTAVVGETFSRVHVWWLVLRESEQTGFIYYNK